MDPFQPALSPHPAGEQPSVEDWSATADTFAGRVYVEWDRGGLVTPLGQLPFFIEYLKQAGLFAGWVADCRLTFHQPERPVQARLAGDRAVVFCRSRGAGATRDSSKILGVRRLNRETVSYQDRSRYSRRGHCW
jgi:hypothetical protein